MKHWFVLLYIKSEKMCRAIPPQCMVTASHGRQIQVMYVWGNEAGKEDPCSAWTHIMIWKAFEHQLMFPVVTLQAKGRKGAGASAAKKASKGGNPVGNPLSGVGTGLPQVGVAPKKAAKAASSAGKKATKTANKAASKV